MCKCASLIRLQFFLANGYMVSTIFNRSIIITTSTKWFVNFMPKNVLVYIGNHFDSLGVYPYCDNIKSHYCVLRYFVRLNSFESPYILC